RRGWAALELEAFAMLGDDHLARTLLLQNFGHGFEGRSFAVDHERASNWPAEASHPVAQLVPVGVGRIACQARHLGSTHVLLTEDPDLFRSILDAPPQRVLCLKADEQNAVAVVARVVRQVMQNSPGL